MGIGDLDAGLQHRRGEHEDEQQHEHDVDQRSDVDLGQRGLGADLAAAAWWRRPWARRSSGGVLLPAVQVEASSMAAFSMALSSSRPKSSMRAPNSRSRAVSWL